MTTDNRATKEDLRDVDFVDAEELASDGYFVYRTGILTSTTLATQTVLINQQDSLDVLNNVDNSIEENDRIYISGSTAADGYYTVGLILDDTSFTVNELILDSVGGTIFYMHPAGSTKIGVDTTLLDNSDGENLQEVLQDLDQAITDGYAGSPPANQIGQVLYSIDGETFQRALPVTSKNGWLVNNCGIHIVTIPPGDD